jgi:tetratricopeptide (TPR) repeat protein
MMPVILRDTRQPGPEGSAGMADPLPRDSPLASRGSSRRRTRLLGVTLLLLLSPASSLCVQPGSHREDALRQLESRLAAGDLTGATALLSRLQPEIDADERFAFDAIYVLIGGRRFPEAKDQWNRLAPRLQEVVRGASGPSPTEETRRRVAEALFVQGLLVARPGEKDEALRLLRQADGYGFPPLDSPLMLVAADCLHELKEYALAEQAYREFLKRSPRSVEARLRLGVVLFSSGQLGPAADELEQVVRQAPRLPLAHYYLGAVAFEQKRTEEAQAHLEQELALDPRCHPCMSKLAHLAYLKGDDRQCESWLAKATALDPDHLETNLVSGMLDLRKGRYEEAIAHLARVVERAPGSARAQYQLALAYQRSGDAAKAREHQEIYNRLIQEEKARSLGVRGAKE